MKRKFGFLVCMFLFVLCMGKTVKADGGYQITGYDVNVRVTEENVYEITETIQVDFLEQRHGIYRDIPLENSVVRLDGSGGITRAKVTDIDCNGENYTVSREGDNCRIKLGSESKTITGAKTYRISYKYDLGNDIFENGDEFYFNLIGSGWENTTIQNVTFTIQMPKSFDTSKIGMSYGPKGSTQTDGLYYQVDGQTIKGYLDQNQTLTSGDALTVRIELPSGYFVENNSFPFLACISILLSAGLLLCAFYLWYKYGKDDMVVETIEFYPPDGMNSAEAAYMYYGNLEDKDITSLIIYLAQKGYYDIEDKKKNFAFIKKKNYDGTKDSESKFLRGLFKKGDVVGKSDLQDSFYQTIGEIKSSITKEYKTKIFYKNSLNKAIILYVLMVLLNLLTVYIPVKNYYGFDYKWNLAFTFVPLGFLFVDINTIIHSRRFSAKIMTTILMIPAAWVMIQFAILDPFQRSNGMYTVAYIVFMIVAFITIVLCGYMEKRTPYGNEMLGKLSGFKKFLETAEKDRLELMVQEHPQYFYDILPYTYIFGISDKWIKKFESIAVEPPNWYYGPSDAYTFNILQFEHFMNHAMRQAQSAMVSSPSSSGGGSSGGGSGGGGGGSW